MWVTDACCTFAASSFCLLNQLIVIFRLSVCNLEKIVLFILKSLRFLYSLYIVRTEYGAGGHVVWTSVSATCSLHLTVPPLVDGCAVWLGIWKPLNFSSKVLSSACTAARSLGCLWVGVLLSHLGHGSEW